MRDLIVTQNITLDGVIDASEGWFGPADDDVDQRDIAEALKTLSAASDALVVGRRTFEDMRGYWPQQTEDETGVTDHLNRVQKYVVSTTLKEPGWERTTIVRDAGELGGLKEREGADIVVTGSMSLMPALIGAGLVDEYRLFVYPVVLGRGTRLFDGVTGVPPLELVEARAFRSGIVLLRHRTKR